MKYIILILYNIILIYYPDNLTKVLLIYITLMIWLTLILVLSPTKYKAFKLLVYATIINTFIYII